jgi:hypothetical protein
MIPNNSDVWVMPAWLATSITGPHDLIPSDYRPGKTPVPGRPQTLKSGELQAPIETIQAVIAYLGCVKRGSPPPGIQVRVAGSFILLAWFAGTLLMVHALGG